ncbi:polypeptide N-acetylgalactosaminyltransferase 1-like [Amphiura filiformis]|uniref:polypeptide N-acetylgalactosaminyltransferase 1-like n=1 Tax=Amphiura filiformis TaxID=82378 RepID=UPI003B217948
MKNKILANDIKVTFSTNQPMNSSDLIQSQDDVPASQLPYHNVPGLGDMGRPVIIDMATHHDEYQKLLKSSGYNLLASNMMSLNRTLADIRPQECASLKYPKILPKTSAVIIFHNEPWSILWRTVHSVINRSPPYMQEIVLVNDASDEAVLLPSRLDDYAKKLDFDIKLFQMETRIGSVKSRNLGVAKATGEIVVILDSHCEVTEGWLEPLVYRVVQDRTRIVTPTVDTIHADTFEYLYGDLRFVGGIQWRLDYMWQLMQPRDITSLNKNGTIPVRTPTIGGGLFAVDKSFWNKLGGFDDGFKIWGGDNLELSFKTWMCGGSMEIMPCSRVGHISRARGTYPFYAENQKRLTEVWIDGRYKEFFYFYNPEIKEADAGNVTDRVALRKRLNCKSFGWYIENVFPYSSLPSSLHKGVVFGQVKHLASQLCLATYYAANKTKQPDNALKTWNCILPNVDQLWSFNQHGEMRHNDRCIDSTSQYTLVNMCNYGVPQQQWTYDNKTQQISQNEWCLDFAGSRDGVVYSNKCKATSETQRWVMDMRQWNIPSSDNQSAL